jgi:hypothetical protein
VGNNSCNGDHACFEAGLSGSSSVGNSSCNGDAACFEAGFNGSSSSIANRSCNSSSVSSVCANNAGTIGNNQKNVP